MATSHPEKPSKKSTPIIELPSWLLPALKSRRKWKTFARSTVVLAAALVLLVDDVTLQSMGQAGFFAALLAIMLPPSMPVSLFVLAATTLLLGMLLGWAWGAAAMAAALRARSQDLLATQMQNAQASLQPNVPTSLQFQQFIFEGRFLDPRSSAVYGGFIFVGAFALGAMRAAVPSLTLLSIFGLIVLDVMCSYGPLFYSAQYTLAKQFLIPTAYYVAIALASLVLIFPESMNHAWLSLMNDGVLSSTSQIFSLQTDALETRPSDRATWESLATKGVTYRRTLVETTQALLGQTPMVDLEFSLGRLGPTDLKRVSGELKSLLFRARQVMSGLLSFINIVYEGNTMDAKDEEAERTQADSRDSSLQKDSRVDRFMLLRRRAKEHEARHGHDLESLVPILYAASTELRHACKEGLMAISRWFDDCNSRRWREFFLRVIGRGRNSDETAARHEVLVAVQQTLDRAIAAFQNDGRLKLIEPYKQLFDAESGKLKDSARHLPTSEKFTARSLYTCFVFCDTLLVFADRLSRFLALIIELDEKRPYVRFWAPSGFGKLGRRLMKKSYNVDNDVAPLAMGSALDPTSFDNESDTVAEDDEEESGPTEREKQASKGPDDRCRRRNPDALPPRTALGRFAVRLGAFVRYFKSAEGILALRTAVVTLALWIPAVCHSSAAFNYEHKGLWALIMAQTSLAMYAGDQIATLFVRLLGTGVGLLFGMAFWYIGSGRGPGNPYGVVVATTILTSPFLFMRIAAPLQDIMLWTMTGITIIFVVGYSWIDTHVFVLASAGVGVEVGWRRALLVIIGFAAAFIVMLFPRPMSARTLVRRTIAASLGEIGHIFASEVEAILSEDAKARRGVAIQSIIDCDVIGVSDRERRVRRLAKRVLEVSTRLQGLAPSLLTGKWEPQFQGVWPQQRYQDLYAAENRLLSCLALLAGAFVRLDSKWCSVLVHKTPFLNPYLLADAFSNIAVLSHALSGGHPIPASLPRLRDRLVYHDRHMFAHGAPLSKDTEKSDGIEQSDMTPEKVDGVTIGFEELTLDILSDDQLPAHSTAVIAISTILGIVDDIADTIRDLCGEMTFESMSALHREYLGREEEAMMFRAKH